MPITSISELKPDAKNARKRGPRAEGMIVKSLHEVGAARSIVIDEDGRILAGNGTVQAAAEAGFDKVQVVDADGETIIAVRRIGLTEAQKQRLAILDNRTGELAEWDTEVLAELVKDGLEIGDLFSNEELDTLLDGLGGGNELLTDPDAIPEDVETRCKAGDLWRLGEHRLLCGDSTSADDVGRLMGGQKAGMAFTDPPYGVDYQGGTKKRVGLSGDDTPDLYEPALKLLGEHSRDDVALYLWHSDSKSAAVSAAVSAAGFERRSTIIWNKNQAQFGALGAQYKTKHEPVYYLHKRGKSPQWHGPTNEVTVWDVDRAQANAFHPTQKPVALATRALENSSTLSDVVYDPFLGSGTTLIACEQLGRKCYGLEIDPHYCDVILQRWENATGKAAERIEKCDPQYQTAGGARPTG